MRFLNLDHMTMHVLWYLIYLYGHELKVYKQLDTSLTLSSVKGLIWSISDIFITVHQSMAAMYCKIFMNNVQLN